MEQDPTERMARRLARCLDAATYAGYRAGFEAAREEAALLAERAGQRLLAAQLRAMRPLPERRERRQ
ncbi:MAG: hypothetical protein RMK64_01485 [Rhodovarius sp.]|nr:hypothetical protein [Rhodovarius sp.]MDW8313616.1 hypothetical protein [Rhodovarius sp.]